MLSYIYSKSSWFLKDKTKSIKDSQETAIHQGQQFPIPPQFSPFNPPPFSLVLWLHYITCTIHPSKKRLFLWCLLTLAQINQWVMFTCFRLTKKLYLLSFDGYMALVSYFQPDQSWKRQNLIGYHFWLKVYKALLDWSIMSWV